MKKTFLRIKMQSWTCWDARKAKSSTKAPSQNTYYTWTSSSRVNYSNSSPKHFHKAYKRNWQGMLTEIFLLRESKANTCSTLKDTWLADLKHLTKFNQLIEPYKERKRRTQIYFQISDTVFLEFSLNPWLHEETFVI